jgi:ABC-type multidrug transport system ATPase subunit
MASELTDADRLPTAPGSGNGRDPMVARGLGIEYRRFVLAPFDLTVGRGETVALLGPNGSGKTTAIRLLLGLERPSLGSVAVHGARVTPLHPPQRVGYVPDKPEFWEWMGAAANLAPFAGSSGEVAATLDTVGLGAVGETSVKKFSRGMRQRLAIARAIVGRPGLLVFDEPTIALDETGVDLLDDVLRRHGERGGAVLVATHDGEFVRRLSPRIVHVVDGKVGARP